MDAIQRTASEFEQNNEANDLQIEFFGCDFLPKAMKQHFENITRKALKRVDGELVIHFKEYKKAGMQRKYSLNMRLYTDKVTPLVIKESGWDLNDTFHRAVARMKNLCYDT